MNKELHEEIMALCQTYHEAGVDIYGIIGALDAVKYLVTKHYFR